MCDKFCVVMRGWRKGEEVTNVTQNRVDQIQVWA